MPSFFGLNMSPMSYGRRQFMRQSRAFPAKAGRKMLGVLKEMGRQFNAEVKLGIRKSRFGLKENAGLTVALKGSRKPLIDSGRFLRNSFSVIEIPSSISNPGVFAGISKLTPYASSRLATNQINSAYKLARLLHEGCKVKVTPKMRNFFAIESKRNPRIKPLSSDTVELVIPPRPFMEKAANNPLILTTLGITWGIEFEKVWWELGEGI